MASDIGFWPICNQLTIIEESKKMSESQTKAGNQKKCENLKK